ncbi:hypothetical protein ACROYT_G010864 [Oculina patagonica]
METINDATKSKAAKSIGPLKRENESLAVDDEEKANLMNTYFSSIGEKLARSVEPLPLRPIIEEAVPRLSCIPLSCSIIEKKLSSLKPSKATGPDGISPKLLKLAGPSVAAPLTNLYVRSMDQGVYNDWKIARLNPVFKKDDETEIGNYRPISLLSVPSKILESCVADALVKHVLLDNRLLTNNQWAYRKGYSTELLLAHLTETWRRVIDSKKVVGVVFIDFQKAFDSVSHSILTHKLKHYFGIEGNLLDWLKDYLRNRKQFTVMNGKKSDYAQVTYGIPQGSVLGPTLFNLYTSDLPDSVTSGEVYMYADDTSIYCVGNTIDHVTTLLNDALNELLLWCRVNSIFPHPKKCEAMVLFRGRFIGALKPLRLGDQNIDWVTHSRLLGVTIDNKLTWSRHILEVKKAFALKLNLINRSRFLPRNMLLDLFFKIILPGVTYALPIWGGHSNKDGFKSLESLHCRAACIIFNFLRDMPSEEVLEKAKWDSIFYKYKLGLAKLVYKVYNDLTPPDMRHIIVKAENKHGLRNGYKGLF